MLYIFLSGHSLSQYSWWTNLSTPGMNKVVNRPVCLKKAKYLSIRICHGKICINSINNIKLKIKLTTIKGAKLVPTRWNCLIQDVPNSYWLKTKFRIHLIGYLYLAVIQQNVQSASHVEDFNEWPNSYRVIGLLIHAGMISTRSF